ncbi:MAG: hypothetical protein JW801_17950 [Bacteroidales bacterium]|nr:hypothetical protein [Bacteroidales bacterium]
MIPSTEEREWRDLLLGKIDPAVTSHLFKIKLITLRQRLKRGQTKLEDAVQELHMDCSLHEDIYRNDLLKIFQNKHKNAL